MKSLEQYLSNSLDVDYDPDISNPNIIKAFKKLLSFESMFYFTKVSYIKKLVSILIADGKFKTFKFKVKRKLKPEAYMHDSGVLYISYGVFLYSSPAVFLTVLCHELAHIWLSQRDDYKDLKELNRKFKQKFQDDLRSPIEVYARIVQTVMLKKIISCLEGKKRKKLIFCLKNEENKLKMLESDINTLKA